MSQQNAFDFFISSKDSFDYKNIIVNSQSDGVDTGVPVKSFENSNVTHTLQVASDNIVYALSHPKAPSFSASSLLIPIITGIVVSSAAFLYNKWHWCSVKNREIKIKTADALIEIVTDLDEVAVDYWMRNYSKKLSRDNTKAEIKMKSQLGLVNTLIPSLVKYAPYRKRRETEISFRKFHDELFDLITGDDFETSSRKSNPSKASQISNKCLKFRVALITII